MPAMKKFSEQHTEVVERQGKRVTVHTAILSPAYRSRRIPKPPPPPLPPAQRQLVRAMVEGKIPPRYGWQDWTRLPRWLL
jgi:hypothetical protein